MLGYIGNNMAWFELIQNQTKLKNPWMRLLYKFSVNPASYFLNYSREHFTTWLGKADLHLLSAFMPNHHTANQYIHSPSKAVTNWFTHDFFSSPNSLFKSPRFDTRTLVSFSRIVLICHSCVWGFVRLVSRQSKQRSSTVFVLGWKAWALLLNIVTGPVNRQICNREM